MKERIIAIVPSAGLGRRFGQDTNKPFETLGGRPVIIWALKVLEDMPEVSEIIPVLKESDIQRGADLFQQYGISKVRRIAPGGKERQDSVFNGLHFVEEKESVVVVHDGVRPFIEAQTIRKALRELSGYDGVVIGVSPKDTIKEVEAGFVKKTLRRDTLCAVQTPQIFLYEVLYEAYETAMKESFYSTDDSALVERSGGRVKVVQGLYANIKVTTPEDLVIAEAFLRMRGDIS